MYSLLAICFALVGVLCILGMRLLLISRCRKGLRLYLRELENEGIYFTCLECNFDLRGSSTGKCPECGNEPRINDESCSDTLRAAGRNRLRPAEYESLYQTFVSYWREYIKFSEHKRTYRIGFGAVLSIAILLLVISVIREINQTELTTRSFSKTNAISTMRVEWGKNKGKLEFVVFERYLHSNQSQFPGLITFVSDINEGNHAWLDKPDGTRIKFPSRFMIIEYIDGEYSESTEQVSLAVFESYLATKPTKYTIDGLLSHAKSKK